MREDSDDDFILEARLTGVDPDMEPIESVVVGDKRDQFGKKLGQFALALLILFFAINGYIQAHKTGQLLEVSREDRSALVRSINNATRANERQTKQIQELQNAIRAQNQLLEEAGFEVVRIPEWDRGANEDDRSEIGPPQNSSPEPRSQSQPDESPEPQPESRPSPDPDRPEEEPPSTIEEVRENICELIGLCP